MSHVAMIDYSIGVRRFSGRMAVNELGAFVICPANPQWQAWLLRGWAVDFSAEE